MKKKTKKLAAKEAVPKYSITLALKQGETYKSTGDTILEALVNLGDLTLMKVKTLGVFTIRDGGKKAEIMMRPLPIKRLLNKFASRFTRELFEKRALMSMKKDA